MAWVSPKLAKLCAHAGFTLECALFRGFE